MYFYTFCVLKWQNLFHGVDHGWKTMKTAILDDNTLFVFS